MDRSAKEDLNIDQTPEYQVNFAALAAAESENDFLRESFELLKEAAQLVALAASALDVHHQNGFARNEAVLVGHLVRMVKLMRSVIRGVVDDHGGDQQSQLVRQFLDSASIVKYLLDDHRDQSRYEAYILDSLISEREFLKNIRQQVAERGGVKLNIEERIERSIQHTFDTAGIQEDGIPGRKHINWPNAETRLKLLGPTAYSAYRTGSGSIHGSWHDLERNHLDFVDGRFQPVFEATPERPQPLFAMALAGVSVAQEYIEKSVPAARSVFGDRFDRYLTKLGRADNLHEEFLAQRFANHANEDPE